jgi:hypothetical protein
MSGIQQGQAFNANEDLSRLRAQQLQESALATELARLTMPEKVRAVGLANERTLGDIASTAANTQAQELKNKLSLGTFDTDMEAAKGKSKLGVLETKAKEQEVTGEMLAQFAGTLDTLPADVRHKALFQFAETSGVPMSQQDIDHYANVKPENLSKHLNEQAIAHIKRSKTYITEMDKKAAEERTKIETKKLEIQGRKELEQMGINAGKHQKVGRAGITPGVAIMKQAPAARLGSIKGILDADRHPDTGEPLTDTERTLYESIYNQDVQVVNAANAARGQQGATVVVGPDGKPVLANRVPPTVGSGPARGTPENPIKLD